MPTPLSAFSKAELAVRVQAAKIPEDLVAEGMLVVNSTKDAVLGTETPQPAQSV